VLQYHRKFLYDGWNLIAEWDGVGSTLVRSFMWGLGLERFAATSGWRRRA